GRTDGVMTRHLLLTLLATVIGAAAAPAQSVTHPHQLPQFAPGPAASPCVPSAPAIAPGPAAPELYGSRKIAPAPAGPADSVAISARPTATGSCAARITVPLSASGRTTSDRTRRSVPTAIEQACFDRSYGCGANKCCRSAPKKA